MASNRRSTMASFKKKRLVTYSNPHSVISDQFRTIRSNIEFITNKQKHQLLLFTSAGNGEGKSTIVANLAVSMAQQRQKVLLIDANLRDPMIHQFFNVTNEVGLTSVLKGHMNYGDAVYCPEVGKLDILTSGGVANNPTELLSSEMMNMLLESVINKYDTVLMDAPSVLTYTETRVIANRSDGVVLVLTRGKTPMRQITDARRVLELAHANLIGSIMTER